MTRISRDTGEQDSRSSSSLKSSVTSLLDPSSGLEQSDGAATVVHTVYTKWIWNTDPAGSVEHETHALPT
jgi:hypothetical protein